MATTIQITKTLQSALTKRKLFDRETYEEVIWDLLEDAQELSAETRQNIAKARKRIAEGKFYTHAQVKEKLGL